MLDARLVHQQEPIKRAMLHYVMRRHQTAFLHNYYHLLSKGRRLEGIIIPKQIMKRTIVRAVPAQPHTRRPCQQVLG